MGVKKLKRFTVVLTLLICVAGIIVGNLHWNNKISAKTGKVTNPKAEVEAVEKKPVEEKEPEFLEASKHLPKELQEKIKKSTASNEPINLIIFGSVESDDTWSEKIKNEILAHYGENVFNISIVSTGDKTTLDIINDKTYEELNSEADVILFEPPMLKDNGVVGIDNTLENVQTIIDSWKEANNELILMVQPPNPIYGATYYPQEVTQLKDYIESKDIVYLNHWENWPDLNDDKMKDFLTVNGGPNENGNKVWADYLINYFIASN